MATEKCLDFKEKVQHLWVWEWKAVLTMTSLEFTQSPPLSSERRKKKTPSIFPASCFLDETRETLFLFSTPTLKHRKVLSDQQHALAKTIQFMSTPVRPEMIQLFHTGSCFCRVREIRAWRKTSCLLHQTFSGGIISRGSVCKNSCIVSVQNCYRNHLRRRTRLL